MIKKALIAVALLLFTLSVAVSCSDGYRKGDTTVVLQIGDYQVTYEEYRYVCMKNAYLQCEELGLEYDPKLIDTVQLQNAVERELKRYYAIEKAAEEYGVSLTKEELNLLDSLMESEKQNYSGTDAYYAALEDMYMSENVCYLQAKNYQLEEKLYEKLQSEMKNENSLLHISEEDAINDIVNHFYATVHIRFVGENAEKSANEMLKRIRADEVDFMEMAATNNADSQKDQIRCYCEGEAYDYYENVALSLKPGEISEVITHGRSAYIIKRVKLDSRYIEEHFKTLEETNRVRVYNSLIENIGKSLDFIPTEKYPGLILE